ncbi:MAG TPA: hypothetical protein VJL61_07035 [Rhodanobacteraceae bacterium]|nr:hypothetical protein [Rhodanobacteraceae bacterium]
MCRARDTGRPLDAFQLPASSVRIGWATQVSAIVFGCVHLPDFKFA